MILTDKIYVLSDFQLRELERIVMSIHYRALQYTNDARQEQLRTGQLKFHVHKLHNIALDENGILVVEYIDFGNMKREVIERHDEWSLDRLK